MLKAGTFYMDGTNMLKGKDQGMRFSGVLDHVPLLGAGKDVGNSVV